ncbi:PEP-CTERM sorting domain-containing protein [Desulfonatronovibrio hydrogenovorans]|uniref:PEP-CTERM sorting domain-containing protein n=1 Tax=Desulfonatronovibrio hydrogenovorans TaxID=53245 RepID=UPI00048F3CE3|nr:PEP-CTERM sorting domain-containing protein [Desulfonatronovibrio hydrogenovorans]
MFKRILLYLLPVIFFLGASTAQASLITLTNYDTYVTPQKSGAGFTQGEWYDKIEAPTSNIFANHGVSLTANASGFQFEINTNFSGYTNIGNADHYIGDFFLFAGNRYFGFNLGKWDSPDAAPDASTPYQASFFQIWDIQKAYTPDHYLGSYQNLIYGDGYKATSFDFTWELEPFVTMYDKSDPNYGTQIQSPFVADFYQTALEDGSYTYTLAGEFDLIWAMNLSWGDSFDFLFATATCANSGMMGSVATTPEPGTWLLFGTGLLGISWLGRKRLIKK